jgi:hypothetical protein
MTERTRTKRPPIDLAVELERAVERNEFGLEYQPIIDLGSGSIAAVEALLRWRHPLMGTIAPGEYLPLAEETGLIVPIGERVLDAATRQLRTWHLGFARMQSLKVNINISPRQLTDPGLLTHVQTVLQRSDLTPSSLTLELGVGSSGHPDEIDALAKVGVGLALEDFGHGSALEDVRELPLSIGRLSGFMGNAGSLLRALAYALMLGREGMHRVGEYATLNANYLARRLEAAGFQLAYPERRATHEFIVTFAKQARTQGVTAMDFAKRLLDYGVHSPTTYFPLLIPECFLIEPTETETQAELDAFVAALVAIQHEADTDPEQLKGAPYNLPVRRLDDVKAARELNLVWQPD